VVSRLLLHACCGPCLLVPYDELALSHRVEVIFFNPNIHPEAEYQRRRDTLKDYANQRGIKVHEPGNEPDLWANAIRAVETESAIRCSRCYELRLEMTARYAAERGFDSIATTLTVSPYQNQEALRAAGIEAAARFGLAYHHKDFTDSYPIAIKRSRELGMYRQNYCGCAFSLRSAASRGRRPSR